MAVCAMCKNEPTTGKSKYGAKCKPIANANFKAMLAEQAEAKAKRLEEFQYILDIAHAAGIEAGNGITPEPMYVAQHEHMLDDNSPIVKAWEVADGVCGFAEVIVTPGNCAFANFLKKKEVARKAYHGGVSVWVSQFGQSMERKAAYAKAFARVLHDNGIKARGTSRMD